MRRFEGFPAGAIRATPLPHQFFSDIVPLIDDLAELKISLHVFWLLSLKKEFPRFVTYRELSADSLIQAGLGGEPSSLRQALDMSVARGTLLHLPVELNGVAEDIYLANTGQGRDAVAKLRSGEIDLGHVVLENVSHGTSPGRPSIYELYEQNIGLLAPLLAEDLAEAERIYPAEWIEHAFKEAVRYNKRHWNYIRHILERWAVEGHPHEDAGRGNFRTAEDRTPYGNWRRPSSR